MENSLARKVGIDDIESIEIYMTPQGPALDITETSEDQPDVLRKAFIPLEALSSYGELLGIDDPVETLAALYESRNHEEPEPDMVTRENVWTDAYTLMVYREQVRESEARKARDEGTQDDPRSPELRATLAAHNAVHQPIDGGECAMDRCRRQVRENLGISLEPTKKCTASTRLINRTIPDVPHDGKSLEISEFLKAFRDHLELCRREFLHELAGNGEENPLQDTTPPEAEEDDPFAATLRKYGAKK